MTTELFASLVFLLAVAASYFGVERFRRLCLKRKWFDVPSERSSHTEPTPRGAGMVVAAITLAGYSLSALAFPDQFFPSVVIAGILIVAISWLDDLYSVPFILRLVSHLLVAAIVIYGVGYFRLVDVPFVGTLDLGHAGIILTFLWIGGLITAYNFMDGIDGLAGGQAVVAGLGWLAVGAILEIGSIAVLGLLISGSALGFLFHNWHPARIFLGDVGSAFLGFVFAVMPLIAASIMPDRAAAMPMLGLAFVWLFVLDPFFTFIHRTAIGEKIWVPGRRHMYQKLIISGKSHKFVSKIYILIASIFAASAVSWLIFEGIFAQLLVFSIIGTSIWLFLYSRKKYIDVSI